MSVVEDKLTKKEYVLPAHGGRGLINRIISEVEREQFVDKALRRKVYFISSSDLPTFYRIADGTLSPLEGPMDKNEFDSVLDNEYVERNGKKYAWTIPIVFPISKDDARKISTGEVITVKSGDGAVVGTLEVTDVYPFDKKKYNRFVYGTERIDHPGPRIVNDDPRDYLLGGKILAISPLRHPSYGKYMLSPEETRFLFKERKWERIIAFQTRNALHRAHEYIMVYALEKLAKQDIFCGVILNPLVGKTKNDDIPPDIRMKTYEALIRNKLIGYGDKDNSFWEKKDYDFYDQIQLIGLDIKMFYAGPKEAIMHAIYRQNHGFTDIIIGRKHADAPFDDGGVVWGDFDAQDKFDELNGELLIKPFKVGFAAYFEEIGRVGLAQNYKNKGYRKVSITGKELRRKLQNHEEIDDRIMRKPVADILRKFYGTQPVVLSQSLKDKNIVWHDMKITKKDRERNNGHKAAVIWLTGLSASGKSTIAIQLQLELFRRRINVFVLDGDNVRHGLNKNLGFSPEDRTENIRRVGEVAKLFTDAGFLVITSFISPYRKDRVNARRLVADGDFIEVFVKADLSVCEQRDPKGFYSKARLGEIKEFTGISAPYEEPEKPEIIVATDKETVQDSVKVIIGYLENNEYISRQVG